MELARFQSVRKDFEHGTVLADVSFDITSEDKVGLVGPNGGGKTTILRILTGEENVTSGAVSRATGIRIGYVPQQVRFDDGETALGAVLREHAAAERDLRASEEALAAATGDAVADAMAWYERASAAYDRAGGDTLPSRAAAMLDALGLAGKDDQPVGALSGGEKNVLSLARALLSEPDLLVLDEPGNHLDFDGMAWLEDFLARFRGGVLVVSHNRYLLDRVATRIIELDRGKTKSYAGNYSAYRAQQLRDKISQQANYDVDQRNLERLEELVKRFRELAARTGDPAWGKRLRARKSQLERAKRDATEKPPEEKSSMRMTLTEDVSRADIALQLNGYTKAFGDRTLFDAADLEVRVGERVALLGPNGAGKTTLVRDIVARGAWDDATLRIGPSLRVGYCAQEQEILDDHRTVLEQMLHAAPMTQEKAFGVLSKFLFGRNDLDKRVRSLSGGERNRLQLALLTVQQPDFLILDEPTNHLDIPACEAIEDALADFKGTILAISHDRYFLDKLSSRVVELRDAKLHSYVGNFSEYWAERRPPSRKTTARVSTRRAERDARREDRPKPRTERQPTSSKVAALQGRIEAAEAELLVLERRASDAFTRGDHQGGTAASNALAAHRARLDRMYEEWLALDG